MFNLFGNICFSLTSRGFILPYVSHPRPESVVYGAPLALVRSHGAAISDHPNFWRKVDCGAPFIFPIRKVPDSSFYTFTQRY